MKNKTTDQVKVFIIRHKETKIPWVSDSGKSSWKQKGHAKNAWAYNFDNGSPEFCGKRLLEVGIQPIFDDNSPYRRVVNNHFDKQDLYEIVELQSDQDVLLQDCLDFIEKIIIYQTNNVKYDFGYTKELLKRGGR